MPNWCHNKLEVRGPRNAIASFQSSSSRDGWLSFAATYPEPSNPGNDESYDWYHWRVEHWGTKWDLGEDCLAAAPITDCPSFGSKCFYSFETAWSPPCGWLEAISAVFPELEFALEYAEVGNNFAGRYTTSAGSVTENKDLPLEEVLTKKEDMWF